MEEETVCKNWFMRKSGKSWIFGCAVFFVLGLATALPVAAEEISQTTAADTAVTEVRTEDSSQTSSQETAVTETTQSEETASKQLTTPAVADQTTEPTDNEPISSSDGASSPYQVTDTTEPQQTLTPADSEPQAKADVQQAAAPKKEEINPVTNLEDMSHDTNGTWEVREDGIHSNAIGKGDSFLSLIHI